MIYILDQRRSRYYRAEVDREWVEKHDNGHLISIGWNSDDNQAELRRLLQEGKAVQVPKDEWNHSGCQSSCIRRGGKECRW